MRFSDGAYPHRLCDRYFCRFCWNSGRQQCLVRSCTRHRSSGSALLAFGIHADGWRPIAVGGLLAGDCWPVDLFG